MADPVTIFALGVFGASFINVSVMKLSVFAVECDWKYPLDDEFVMNLVSKDKNLDQKIKRIGKLLFDNKMKDVTIKCFFSRDKIHVRALVNNLFNPN